jgi:opacity protein-like surface antigen
MNRTIRSLVVTGSFALFALAPSAYSQGKIYLHADAGVALAEDVDVHRFLGPANGKFELEPGVRFSAAGGYNFNPYIGAELETGFIANTIEHSDNDASLSHVPLLANIVFRYDTPRCPFIPFAGAGIGGDVSIIAFDDVRTGGAHLDGSDGTFVFAWQAFIGLRYRINDRMSIGGAYKFYAADDASWDVDGARGDIEVGRSYVHTFGCDFTMSF